jgi:hypothetical protein
MWRLSGSGDETGQLCHSWAREVKPQAGKVASGHASTPARPGVLDRASTGLTGSNGSVAALEGAGSSRARWGDSKLQPGRVKGTGAARQRVVQETDDDVEAEAEAESAKGLGRRRSGRLPSYVSVAGGVREREEEKD